VAKQQQLGACSIVRVCRQGCVATHARLAREHRRQDGRYDRQTTTGERDAEELQVAGGAAGAAASIDRSDNDSDVRMRT